MSKKTVVILFGGQSSEHEVSRVSASTIISNIDDDKYYVIPVGITKEGKWMIYNGPVENIKNGEWEKFGTPAILSPDASHKGLLKLVGGRFKLIPVDVVFPVLHGCYGEDGTVQGLLELAKIPYVGCGVVASGISMDKEYTKIIAKNARIHQAKYVRFMSDEIKNIGKCVAKVEKSLGYPCFVKPANAGSSVGVSKASDGEELEKALIIAAKYDKKVLVEEAIIGREVECSVLGSNRVSASTVGEIFAGADFYDYDAKYNSNESRTVIPADIDPETEAEIRKISLKVFKAVGGRGLSRIDFFIEKDTGKVVFNEINTMPGFTAISMYPKLWEAMGKPISELIDDLISMAALDKA